MPYLLSALLGYGLGCINPAYILAKLRGFDIREKGSRNAGASNVVITLGKAKGIFCAAFDIGKAALAVLLARLLFNPVETFAVTAAACILGHIFPFYLKFRGGKGFASYLGMTLALNWKFAIVILVLVGVAMVVTDYIVAGTTLTILSTPVYMGIITHNLILALILCIATAVIIYKHRDNYVRIWNGTEIGLRSAAKGEHRVK